MVVFDAEGLVYTGSGWTAKINRCIRYITWVVPLSELLPAPSMAALFSCWECLQCRWLKPMVRVPNWVF